MNNTKDDKKNILKYTKMDPITHIRHRPDMYCGSIKQKEIETYTSDEKLHISKKNINVSPAFIRIFIEPMSNVIDNYVRSKNSNNKCSEIRIEVNKESGEIVFWNDGNYIPIEVHKEEKCYNHTLIFGYLLTSSNYDDEEDRYDISGKNGIGGKVSVVFSKEFTVTGIDPKKGKIFKQTWKDGMKNVSKPIIEDTDIKKSYTEVRFIPDFKYFGMEGITDDIVELFRKYVIDTSMITKTTNVYFNNKIIDIHNLEDYAKLYSDNDTSEFLNIKTKDCEIFLTPSRDFESISFANGIITHRGGTHVNSWSETLFRPILDKLNKPKKPQLTILDVKKCFRLFVVASVNKPVFDSQEKEVLEGPEIVSSVKTSDINKICKWSVMERLQDMIYAKEFIVLKKTQRKKRGHTKIEGLDPANNEGGKNGHQCTLILVEGLSAKTFAVSGIEVGAYDKTGRDWYGIFPLRGKLLNCRNCKPSSISNNKVITSIIQALGLEYDVDYKDDENYRKLRYGRVMIITDSDCDGIHISSLIQNAFHSLFPSLLERKQSFIVSLQTPIVRVFLKGQKDKLFYDEISYKNWVEEYKKENPTKKIEHKYYKGLGTSNDKDVKETFGKKIIEFVMDVDTLKLMNKVFCKTQSDARKEWLSSYNPNSNIINWIPDKVEIKQMNISHYLNNETIKFSFDDCKRSIPNILDGLKESHRKVLYSCFKRNLSYNGKTLKVAQLSGYVAEHSGYHHGEQNLFDTITKMAQFFVGSNNIPLLYRDGQFGSRINNGKDAANARYIFTKIDELTRLIYKQEDDILLDNQEDDGDIIEPKFYIPILPMILVNGITAGIGTGWSCNIPSYNPLELVECIKIWLENNGSIFIEKDDCSHDSILPKIKPWYSCFTGKIEKTDKEGQFKSYGNVFSNGNKKIINELPIGMSTDKFKDFLEDLKVDKKIKNYKNHSKTKTIHFVLTEEDEFKANEESLKLHDTINTSNMVAFTENNQICKFDTIDEIIDYFCGVRYRFYMNRKKHQINELQKIIKFLGNKYRFLKEVMNDDIKLFEIKDSKRTSRTTKDLVKELEKRKYDKELNNSNIVENENKEDDSESLKGYNYLLGMQFRSITEEKINKLNNEIESKNKILVEIKNISEKDMWLNDLDNFIHSYKIWYNKISTQDHNKDNIKKSKK